MKVTLALKVRRRRGHIRSLLAQNPVLILGIDLPFVIACATSLKSAVALSIEMLLIHMVTMIAAIAAARRLPAWSRILAQVLVSTVVMTFARSLVIGMFPDLSNYVGSYIYLMAVNGLTLWQGAAVTRREKPGPVLARAFLYVLAFSATMLVVSLFREVLAGGTLWGAEVSLPIRLGGFLTPFGGFILFGFLLAFLRFVSKRLLALSISEAIRRDARYTEIN